MPLPTGNSRGGDAGRRRDEDGADYGLPDFLTGDLEDVEEELPQRRGPARPAPTPPADQDLGLGDIAPPVAPSQPRRPAPAPAPPAAPPSLDGLQSGYGDTEDDDWDDGEYDLVANPTFVPVPVEQREPQEPDDPFSPLEVDEDPYEDDDDAYSLRSLGGRGAPSRARVTPGVDDEADDFDAHEDDEDSDEEPVGRQKPTRAKPTRGGREKPSRKRSSSRSKPTKERSKPSRGRERPSRGKPEPTRAKPSRKDGDEESTIVDIPIYETEDTFVDKKNVRLLPFGRKERDVNPSEFDSRNNYRQKARLVRGLTWGLLGVLVLLGVKNALIPPKTLSEEEVLSIVAASRGDTGFPLAEGGAFAADFMESYLTVNSSPYSQVALDHFYGEGGRTNMTPQGSFEQKIITGPTVYKSATIPDTSNAAVYTVGALVSTAVKDNNQVLDGTDAKWTFYSVSVFYDKKTNAFSIAPKSPVAVPAVTVANGEAVPQEAPLGKGQENQQLRDEVAPTVRGYIQGYAISSINNHAAVDQYITDPNEPALVSGMDNRYTISGDPETAISVKAYPSAVEGRVQVLTDVTWEDSAVITTIDGVEAKEQPKNTIASTYIVTLDKQVNGKYLVSNMSPYIYRPVDGGVSDEKQ